jgi:hypothetical protein
MKTIDRITHHYAEQQRLIIHVPEWGEDGNPLEIHVMPMTMAEVNMMQKIASKKASNVEQAVNVIVVKAKDKDGNRIFSISDRDTLMQNADYAVVSRIAEKIESHFFGDVETHKGNSAETLSAISS